MEVHTFFDPATWTLTYLVYDPSTKDAVIIDPVLDYDPLRVSVSTGSAEEVAREVEALGLEVHWVMETHAHADHLSGAQFFKERLGAGIVIGEHIRVVQRTFKEVFHLEPELPVDGSQFDHLVTDGEVLKAGALEIGVIHTPGHTPACVTYHIGDALFTGDALFMPDFGTGRCDFPAGSAEDLYVSVHDKLYTLPDDTRVFVGHDYQPGGRELRFETTIGESKEANKQLRDVTSREDFVRFRTERDAQLSPPKLIFQSVQVNIRAGQLPPAEANGRAYLKLPINLFG